MEASSALDPGTGGDRILNPQLRQLRAQIIAYRILAGLQPLPPKSLMAVKRGTQISTNPD